ncbi:FG-GAP-like repeat-containing protein [Planctomycetota bacterium]
METGVDFIAPIDVAHPRKYLYHSGFMSGGVAIGDVDGDDRPDLFLVSGPGENKLYRQTSTWKFEDITDSADIAGGSAWGAGAAMVDVDNDGDLDIYVCNYDSPNQLYLNDGKGHFADVASDSGLDLVDASLQPAFCDYDRDGDLDLYVTTYRYYCPEGVPPELRDKRTLTLKKLAKFPKYLHAVRGADGKLKIRPVGRPDRLFRNDGQGHFTDVTAASGIQGPGFGLSSVWWDYDQDGWPDLYVANDFNDPDRLYKNNRNGTFTESIDEVVPHTSNTSMGSDLGDINNDGRIDFLVADMSATTHFMQKLTMGAMGASQAEMEQLTPHQYMRNALYLNTGGPRLMEVAYLASLADTDWTWAVKIADLDNDGLSDVFITNGITRSFNSADVKVDRSQLMVKSEFEVYEKTAPRREQNRVYRNHGDLHFTEQSESWNLDHVGISSSAAYADMDRDGDLDLVVMNLDEPVSVYRNDAARGHRILLRLVGRQSNRHGIGATVRLHSEAGTEKVRMLMPNTGFQSSNEPIVHFGMGEEATIARLEVHWPSGHRQSFKQLPADQFYTITEPGGEPPSDAVSKTTETMFVRSKSLNDIRHREQPYNDFGRQPLLPHKLSQLGPGQAWGDVDGDGLEDVYLGGAKGQAGSLLHNLGEGKFVPRPGPWDADKDFEDMGSLLLDIDGDNDLDLYVVSGGVECDINDVALRDRLFLNDGKGNFSRAPTDSVPDLRDSGSVVSACDFDRDGDLDLFVGGRVVPGKYPSAASSRLLRNDDGRLVDATPQFAPGLLNGGLVTAAVWSDATGDGWPDLIVTREWGSVMLWKNDQGRKLVDRSADSGLEGRTGWWNGVASADLDGDGDFDYVVTNFGLNTKYHASDDKPALLYYGDFEGEGRAKLVEAEHENAVIYPVRGKSCSTRAMPFLGEKFTTYTDFARASLGDIYTPQCLNDAQRFAATTLESGVLLNDGQGQFSFHPLPRVAQASPAFGVVISDFNGDRHPDIYLVQNFYSPQWETGRMDGGLSLLLLGNGDGTFRPVMPGTSGLSVHGDAKSVAVTDLDGDSWPDLVVGVNDDNVVTFRNLGLGENKMVTVKLTGPRGNPTAVGAKVKIDLVDGSSQVAEVYAGSGYLTQSSPSLNFGLGEDGVVGRVEVTWPDGRTTSVKSPSAESSILSISY